jgi:hypothetical protein
MAWLTEQDVSNYGGDLINFSQRAALEAVVPHLQNLEQQNAQLQQQLAVESRRSLDQRVAALLPNYSEIDADPRWHDWLRTVDPLSGRVRQILLDDAIAARDAHRIVRFFQTFLAQERASGGQASSGHAASGQSVSSAYDRARRSAPSGRTYSRDEVARLYRQYMQGAYRGREDAWMRQEYDIIAAGREGRIVGGINTNGK